jgi:hypothetical protein
VDLAQVLVIAVIAARLVVPLLIIRWPLPAIVACLLIDAADQTIFQVVVPDADLSGYQGYDKALDIYYLTIAYISTLRNWTSGFAVTIARFLIYYRLVGVVLFELSGIRELLFIFPNTFEYFFIFYEAVRLRWDPRRMSARVLIGATAFIWIFIKLPQEWWIHIAQLDTTDLIKERILGVSADATWSEAIAARPWVVVVAVVLVVLLLLAAWWVITRKLPPADRGWTIDADDESGRAVPAERLAAVRGAVASHLFTREVAEKVALIALVSIIFGQVLGVRSDPVELALVVGIVVVANAALSALLARRGVEPGSVMRQALLTGLLNVAVAATIWVIVTILGGPPRMEAVGFFVLLITLLITLYDRYRPEYLARHGPLAVAP